MTVDLGWVCFLPSFVRQSVSPLIAVTLGLSLAPTLAWAEGTASGTALGTADASQSEQESQQTTQPPESAANDKPQSEAAAEEPKGEGLWGPYRFGPMIALQLPGGNHLSLEGRLHRVLGLSIGLGGFATEADNVEFSAGHLDAKARWFPFMGDFFVGLGLGSSAYRAQLTKDLSLSVNGVQRTTKTTFEARIARTEVTPMFGWQWLFEPGFTLGLDLGAHLALNSSSKLNIKPEGLTDAERAALEETSDYKDARKKVDDDFLDVVQDAALPYLSLGIGWLF
jgi:hypothetical protein